MPSKSNKKKSVANQLSNPLKRGRRKTEIVFDPDARKEYLQGFSERKRQRRAYGLAMQKVKDRKAKLENRKDLKEAERQQIEEAEKHKAQVQSVAWLEQHPDQATSSDEDEDDTTAADDTKKGKQKKTKSKEQQKNQGESQHPTDAWTKMTRFQDEQTKAQWGGDVIVTTSAALPDSDEELEVARKKKKRKRNTVDDQQQYAGDVQRFLTEITAKMPGKRKTQRNTRHKGKHGAAGMKGVGTTTDLKIAQKALARSQTKHGSGSKSKKGRKGKR